MSTGAVQCQGLLSADVTTPESVPRHLPQTGILSRPARPLMTPLEPMQSSAPVPRPAGHGGPRGPEPRHVSFHHGPTADATHSSKSLPPTPSSTKPTASPRQLASFSCFPHPHASLRLASSLSPLLHCLVASLLLPSCIICAPLAFLSSLSTASSHLPS